MHEVCAALLASADQERGILRFETNAVHLIRGVGDVDHADLHVIGVPREHVGNGGQIGKAAAIHHNASSGAQPGARSAGDLADFTARTADKNRIAGGQVLPRFGALPITATTLGTAKRLAFS